MGMTPSVPGSGLTRDLLNRGLEQVHIVHERDLVDRTQPGARLIADRRVERVADHERRRDDRGTEERARARRGGLRPCAAARCGVRAGRCDGEQSEAHQDDEACGDVDTDRSSVSSSSTERRGTVSGDAAVAHLQDALAPRRDGPVVGDQNDRPAGVRELRTAGRARPLRSGCRGCRSARRPTRSPGSATSARADRDALLLTAGQSPPAGAATGRRGRPVRACASPALAPAFPSSRSRGAAARRSRPR